MGKRFTNKNMPDPQKNIPLYFCEGSPTDFRFKEVVEEGKPAKASGMEMVANSGKPFTHPWLGNVGIDFSGMVVPKGRLPILMSHDTERPIGHGGKPTVDDEGLHIPDISLLANDDTCKFYDNSKAGFPYQASIYPKAIRLQRLDEGEEAEVNGHKISGPGVVYRKWVLKEASVVVFGQDPNTSSEAFAESGGYGELPLNGVPVDETKHTFMEGENMPTIEQFKESDPQGYADLEAKLTEKITADVSAKFAADGKAKDDALAASTAQVSALSDAVKDMQFQFAVIAEKEMAAQAKGIVAVKLSASKIPARLHDFVQVGYDKFVEDKKFNAEKFAEAVDTAIKDVETRLSEAGMGATAPTIIGGGMPPMSPDSTEKFSDEDGQKAAADLLKGFGIVIPA